MTLPSLLVWSVWGPFPVTAPLLFIHLSPCRVQSFTSSHIGRSNVQWTGRYSESWKKSLCSGYLDIVLSCFMGNYCFHRLSLKKLSFKWFQDYSILNLCFLFWEVFSILKLISKNTIFENQYFFFKIEWMDQLFIDYYINKILSKKQLYFLEIHALIIEIKTVPGRKLQNGEVFCVLKGIWKS